MHNLRFWQRIYITVLALFLLCVNGTVFAVCILNKTQSDNAYKKQALSQHQMLVKQTSSDIQNVKNTRPYALESVFTQAEQLFFQEGLSLQINHNDEVLISNLPEELKQNIKKVNPGTRGYYVDKVSNEAYFVIISALPNELDGYVITSAQSIEASQNQWSKTIILLTLISFIVSTVLAVCLYATLSRLSRPLINLAKTAERFAEGDHEVRAKEGNRTDEIALLARSFNNMVDKTQQDMQELLIASEEKQRLVDSISHEMRTPLTAIHGYAEYIQRANLSDEEKYEATQYIMSESNRLEQVANQLLKMAVMRNEEVIKQKVDLLDLMRRTYRTVLPKAGLRGVKVQMEKPSAETIMGDAALLESLLVNLIDNAVKACGENGVVKISVSVTEKQVIFIISDNGRGMTAEQLENIGRPFYRADKARSRAEGGAGLGLSLCFQIVKCHNGTLTFSSKQGEGTKATLVLENGDAL